MWLNKKVNCWITFVQNVQCRFRFFVINRQLSRKHYGGGNKLALMIVFLIFGWPIEPRSAQKIAGKGAVNCHDLAR